jgi:hypothetical protein
LGPGRQARQEDEKCQFPERPMNALQVSHRQIAA